MAQLTVEERRRIFVNRQRNDRELLTRLSAREANAEPRPASRGLRRIFELTVVAALLTAGWLVSHGVAFQVPASLAEMLPRL
jgi:hypothetical protein